MNLQLRQSCFVICHEVNEDHPGTLNDHSNFESELDFDLAEEVLQGPVAITMHVKLKN